MVLASAISPTQNQWDYLAVLAEAIRRYGAPEALVMDGGAIFSSNQAIQLYDMLGIRKERIDPGQPWQDYAETLFSIQRRLADHSFAHARTWAEIQQAHQTWWKNYYENTLKVEHQATTLSLYAVRLSSDQQQITEVKNARRLETHFRSPQLDLWQLSETEWLLALRRPEPVVRKKQNKIVTLAEQLTLPVCEHL